MEAGITIVPLIPFDDGVAAGRKHSRATVVSAIKKHLRTPLLKDNLGAMSWSALERYVMAKLETPPNYTLYPELQDIYPERIEWLRGFAKGAGCNLATAAMLNYVRYRHEIDGWWTSLNPRKHTGHCSGVLLVGPDGVLGGQSVETGVRPKPRGYKEKSPKPYRGLTQLRTSHPKLVLRKPRTGYIESWGATNECGLGLVAGNSCSTWLDDPIEDTWPIKHVPLLRFASNVRQLIELYRRYNLFNWNRSSMIFADTSGDAVVVEKSFRRIGFRPLNGAHALWCSEGHFQSDEMSAFIRAKRLEYVARVGRHLGTGDLQYANDSAVRFTEIGAICHEKWGRGCEHMRRILTHHAPFPRAVCRHVGPDTARYDRTPTVRSFFLDITRNRRYEREWIPWRKFCCEVPEQVTQYPARPY